jgi:polyferredoxin
VLVILLPILSKKRIQCGLFCPMGAFLSCTSRINLFGVRIEKDRCKGCNRCIEACTTFALSKEDLERGRPSITCSKCGACFESCPEGAIVFSTLGVPLRSVAHGTEGRAFWRTLGRDLWDPGVVFIFGIFVLSNVFAGGYVSDAASRLLKYFLGV